jgi:AcrR family transcriptional regulator
MAPPDVKRTRRYESPRRREQAAATRAAILDAARRLFVDRGYAATTMAAIAAEAGVALKTVYVAFDGKAALLRELWHLLLRGDQEDVPMPEHPWYRQMLAEPDPGRRLRLMARTSRAVKERAAPLLEAIRGAAPSDPEIAALWERIGTEFHAVHVPLLEGLEADGALRPGLGASAGADVLWTLNHPSVWQLLVVERGWSPARYERWLGDAACSELLGRPHPPPEG